MFDLFYLRVAVIVCFVCRVCQWRLCYIPPRRLSAFSSKRLWFVATVLWLSRHHKKVVVCGHCLVTLSRITKRLWFVATVLWLCPASQKGCGFIVATVLWLCPASQKGCGLWTLSCDFVPHHKKVVVCGHCLVTLSRITKRLWFVATVLWHLSRITKRLWFVATVLWLCPASQKSCGLWTLSRDFVPHHKKVVVCGHCLVTLSRITKRLWFVDTVSWLCPASQKGCGLWTLSCDFVPHHKKVVVCGHCLVTLSRITINETWKWLSSAPPKCRSHPGGAAL